MVKALKRVRRTAEEIVEETKNPTTAIDKKPIGSVVSTGSTLLDLAISGKVVRGGGVPGGILVEIFGPSSSGKTAVLAETAASVQAIGGDVEYKDPEGRLNKEYCRIYGAEITDNYSRPDTVKEMFKEIWSWTPANPKAVNMIAADSLAALSTELEMGDEDKMGMKRAKDFSEALRKTCRMIANNNWLIMCSNQERESPTGLVTPGGKAIPYYSSLRIRLTPSFKGGKIKKKIKQGNKEIEKVIGIYSIAEVKKSSIDDPFRTAPVYIIFKIGIDDIRGNLQWYKDMTGSSGYFQLGTDKGFKSITDAIIHIEENNMESDLRELVIDLWEEIESKFEIKRKEKVRF